MAEPQWAAGLFYDLNEQHELHLTYAKKHRFATFGERNAFVTDSLSGSSTTKNKPNAELRPTEMHHFEFGYKGYFMDSIRVTSAIYTNYELDKIAQVMFDQPDSEGYTAQYQNIDEVLYYGVEFGAEMFLNKFFSFGGSMGVTRDDVLHSERDYVYLGYIPMITANGYMTILPFAETDTGVFKNIKISPRFEYTVMLHKYN